MLPGAPPASPSRRDLSKLGSVSAKLPQNYLIHTIVIAIVLVVAMVMYLRSAWG